MHILFSEEEKEWIYLREFGWPIKRGCPSDIRKAISKKKELLNNQIVGAMKEVADGKR